jgi:CheY-like chemotaxis protein
MTSERQDALLIVEDDPDDLHLLLRAFRRSGDPLPLRTARDGREAVDYLQRYGRGETGDRLLAVLLDLKLPVLSGFEVLEVIKAEAATRAVPVVILTSSAESTDIRKAYELGANSYLVKPAEPAALASLVNAVQHYWIAKNVTAS